MSETGHEPLRSQFLAIEIFLVVQFLLRTRARDLITLTAFGALGILAAGFNLGAS